MQCLDDKLARVVASTDRFTREMYTCDELGFTAGTGEGSSVRRQNRGGEKGHKDKPRIYDPQCVYHTHSHTNIRSVHTVDHNNWLFFKSCRAAQILLPDACGEEFTLNISLNLDLYLLL